MWRWSTDRHRYDARLGLFCEIPPRHPPTRPIRARYAVYLDGMASGRDKNDGDNNVSVAGRADGQSDKPVPTSDAGSHDKLDDRLDDSLNDSLDDSLDQRLDNRRFAELIQDMATVSMTSVEPASIVGQETVQLSDDEARAASERAARLPIPEPPERDGLDFEALSREASQSAADAIRIEAREFNSASPEEAMWHNELARYHFVINVVLTIVVVSWIVIPFMGGSSTIKVVLFASMVPVTIASVWHRRLLKTPERVTRAGIIVTWLTVAVASCLAVAYFGLFSQANIMLAMELMLVGLTGHRLLITLFFSVIVLFVAVMGGLMWAGVISDPGLIHASYLDGVNQLLALSLTQMVMVAGLLLGLSTRREIVTSLSKLQRAARQVEHQQAMVREVRQDLKRAANIGGRGPLTGQVLGSFKLGVLIGRGGMGEVYQATHAESQELAAVKVLQISAMSESGAMRRFAREVAVARSLVMPNIVRVLEVGTEGSVPYLAMEFLRGHDLARYLRKRGHLGLDRIVKLVREVGAGIHAAGEAGVVHRDIKPHNLFLAELGTSNARRKQRQWKILDFGVATAQSHTGTLTQGRIIGTPAYMAPEQARGLSVTHAADLYALASIVYRALTGHPPFSGDDLPSLLYRVVHEMPRQPTSLADVPDAFDDVLAVGMAKAPEDRFASAKELADAVSEAAHGRISDDLRRRAEALRNAQPWH